MRVYRVPLRYLSLWLLVFINSPNVLYTYQVPPSRPSPKGEGDLFPLGGNKKGGKEVERILVIGNEYLIILKEKKAMAKKNYLVNGQTIIDKAAFPAIDAHNHLWGNWQVERVIKTMDEVGVSQLL